MGEINIAWLYIKLENTLEHLMEGERHVELKHHYTFANLRRHQVQPRDLIELWSELGYLLVACLQEQYLRQEC